ncbi:DoxX family protein [Flavobacterium agricola]|uniref:DoxX family protein n=1 Tax=Flavobacterium agricola TaxID=2870839 RepID=A0ABY6M3U0_9FLAO|nr:BT_3928 family protein [Flavobacterium agricola]UYW02185.1 DoxX family protein [Flavobacterium agricola]
MKVLVKFAQYFVGILFIISGLIKLNDPVGFSFKLEEYFSESVLNLPFLIPFALLFAVVVVIFEIVLGVALLLGYKAKLVNWLLLGLIVFFTFLTFYSAYFNKVTDCGCFGDAIKLTPWESFTKDIVLLVLILILMAGEKYIKPVLDNVQALFTIFISYTICLFIAYYVLNHLPITDFRAYKVGTDIAKGMEIPADAPKDEFEMTFVYNINGVDTPISYNEMMSNGVPEGATFVSSESKLIKKGYEAPIHDFSIEKDGQDYTEQVLNQDKVVLYTAYDLTKSDEEALVALNDFTKQAQEKGYQVLALTATNDENIAKIKNNLKLTYDFYFCDGTTIKTIERANPSIVVLNKGVIMDKKHFNDLDQINL